MRIGYMYDMHVFPPKGGNHVHAWELLKGFLRRGHNVAVVDDPTVPEARNFGGDGPDLSEFVKEIDVLYIRIDARLTRKWKAMEAATNLAVGRCPIVWEINAPADEALAYSWLGGRLSGSGGGESRIRRLRRRLHAARQLPKISREERFRRRLADRIDAAICVSRALGDYAISELDIRDVTVLPNGGPLLTREEIERRSVEKNGSFTVFYSGSAIYPWQGLDVLTRTIDLAKTVEPEMSFVLAVNQRTAGLAESENTVIREGLDRDKVLDAACSADACVSLHPRYPWTKRGFHNSPMKLFEYMACMRPVVASDHGQMRDLIRDGENGLLVENDPKQVLSKLTYLRDNPTKAQEIGFQAWTSVKEQFNWENNVTETLRLFERLLR